MSKHNNQKFLIEVLIGISDFRINEMLFFQKGRIKIDKKKPLQQSRSGKKKLQPVGESNPCFQDENLAS